MSGRKVDEALERLAAAAHEWNQAARLILRYGNTGDMEKLEEEAEFLEHVLRERARERAGEKVARRLRREIDKVVADGIARGNWPDEELEE